MTSVLTGRKNGSGPAGLGEEIDLDGPGSGGARNRSRSPEIVLGVLVLVVSALASLYVFTSSTERASVLAMARPVERGQIVAAEDLVVVEVGSDDALATMTRSRSGEVVGRRALVDLTPGVLLSPSLLAGPGGLTAGDGVVGLDLTAGAVPSLRLEPGSTVAVILTPAVGDVNAEVTGGGAAALGEVLVAAAEVVEVVPLGSQGRLFVALSMTQDEATAVSVAASVGRVRLVQVAGR